MSKFQDDEDLGPMIVRSWALLCAAICSTPGRAEDQVIDKARTFEDFIMAAPEEFVDDET